MFYVSSKRGNKYGITDTRDGVEEFYTPKEMVEFRKMGIRIDTRYYVSKINIPIPDMTKQFLVRHGYAVSVVNGHLIKLIFDKNQSDKYVVEFSSFCNYIEDDAVRNWNRAQLLLLVFDDNVDFGVSIFDNSLGLNWANVQIDLRKVTNLELYVKLILYFDEVVRLNPRSIYDIKSRYAVAYSLIMMLHNVYNGTWYFNNEHERTEFLEVFGDFLMRSIPNNPKLDTFILRDLHDLYPSDFNSMVDAFKEFDSVTPSEYESKFSGDKYFSVNQFTFTVFGVPLYTARFICLCALGHAYYISVYNLPKEITKFMTKASKILEDYAKTVDWFDY